MGVISTDALARSGLLGAWELVSCTITDNDSQIEHPYGTSPRGLIAYTNDGWMSCQMIGGELGYSAYYGPCSLDEAAGIVTHHVCGSTHPFTSGDQTRCYLVDGLKLHLSAQIGDGVIEVMWQRPRQP